MPQVHTLRKIAPTIIVLMFLAASSDVIIFHRAGTANLLRAARAGIPRGFFELAIALLTGLALLGLLIILRPLTYSVASFVRYLWAAPQSYDGIESKDRITLENDLRANRIQVITTVVQALGGIALLIGIYFAWANLKTTQKTQKDTQKSQTETIRLTNEGQITDRFIRAIDQLGATDKNGNPVREIRLGGIYGLRRIAQNSYEDYKPIRKILNDYIRLNAPCPAAVPAPGAAAPQHTDIQAALDFLGAPLGNYENKERTQPINLPCTDLRDLDLTGAHLEGANLEGADLMGVNFTDANLTGANLRGAILFYANLKGADLSDARLQGAQLMPAHSDLPYIDLDSLGPDLTGAHLEGVDLRDAHMEGENLKGADLKEANLGGARLRDVHLEGANLTRAHLEGARLRDAHLQGAHLKGAHLTIAGLPGADLSGADLSGADLSGADLSGAHLTGSIGLTQSQVNSARGDKNTVLPPWVLLPMLEPWKHPTWWKHPEQ